MIITNPLPPIGSSAQQGPPHRAGRILFTELPPNYINLSTILNGTLPVDTLLVGALVQPLGDVDGNSPATWIFRSGNGRNLLELH